MRPYEHLGNRISRDMFVDDGMDEPWPYQERPPHGQPRMNFNNSRYYRMRQQQYGYHYVCKYCSQHHRNQTDKCYIMCQYCHTIHFKKDIRNLQNFNNVYACPNLYIDAQREQNKKSYQCDMCGGLGRFQKVVLTTFCQPLSNFQFRSEEFERSKQKGEQGEVPVRKVYKTEEKITTQNCSQCKGKGRIYRVIDCCEGGCRECGYNKVKVNPRWRQIRMRGEQNDQIFPCRICSEQVNLNEKILKLNCGHVFHRMCVLQRLATSQKKCYLCRETDPFLQGQDYSHYIIESQMEQILKQSEAVLNLPTMALSQAMVPQINHNIDESSVWYSKQSSANSSDLNQLELTINNIDGALARMRLDQVPSTLPQNSVIKSSQASIVMVEFQQQENQNFLNTDISYIRKNSDDSSSKNQSSSGIAFENNIENNENNSSVRNVRQQQRLFD